MHVFYVFFSTDLIHFLAGAIYTLRAGSKLTAPEGEEGEGEGDLADVFTVANNEERQLCGMLLHQEESSENFGGAHVDDDEDYSFLKRNTDIVCTPIHSSAVMRV